MSDLFKNKYRISSARLQNWDYGSNGMYFITICTKDRECFFGDIVETRCIASPPGQSIEPGYKMELIDLGKKVEIEWLKTKELRPDMNLELDNYVVMPNHFHGIIFIDDNQYNIEAHNKDRIAVRDAMHRVSTIDNELQNRSKNKFGPQAKNLASIIRSFKSAVTNHARKNNLEFDWQARFHDHIIRSKEEYIRIANYIANNPKNWQEDKFYSK